MDDGEHYAKGTWDPMDDDSRGYKRRKDRKDEGCLTDENSDKAEVPSEVDGADAVPVPQKMAAKHCSELRLDKKRRDARIAAEEEVRTSDQPDDVKNFLIDEIRRSYQATVNQASGSARSL